MKKETTHDLHQRIFFYGFLSFRKYFFRFSQRAHSFWLRDFFVFVSNVEFFSFNMANDCIIAVAMVQTIKKNKKGNCEASLDERVVEEKG